ncbi:sulfite exporter TauE/SafE family protein [Marinobacter sp. 2_MG-2023]|uniref:sulfite exporter TauE/SafE family protein n=1 Tax=Marinobacter sp. 2_MG-2023 TaxID=3062679 RepID=UPI0026E197D5|nr:sulfite exporter TauE/SafE family protein [Marinobacter sp. 2_MG-2023]MDO6441147.1 sulfite exporter TauE/SafE family protein [Marinobacter sp. 2_MG-2023]
MLSALVFFSLVGAVAGVIAGLFGIGGGVVIVPALIVALNQQGVDPAVVVHLAIGTSLAIITVTGASSAFGHWKKGAVAFHLLRQMLPGLMAGAVLGGLIADQLPADLLERYFGIFMLVLALRMLFSKPAETGKQPVGLPVMLGAGGLIGAISALFGIGGGVLNVPWLARNGASMARAIGTSAACGLPIAAVGAGTFVLTGQGQSTLPAYSSGYLYWPAFVGIALISVPCARLGVRLAHHLSPQLLKRLFAFLMLLVGFKLII